MTGLDVPLESIRPAFQGVIPSPIVTASRDGIPNTTYLSIVWYVDEERIAVSNQFLGKTLDNLRENPLAVLRVVDPTNMAEYELELTHLRSESSGEFFEAVRTQLEAVAAQSGMQDVFHLRSIEVLRVDRCVPARRPTPSRPVSNGTSELLSRLDTFTRRLAECRDLAEATRAALQSLDDLFGYERSILLLADADREELFVVASNGHAAGTVGTEAHFGEGAIGVAAKRLRQVRVGHVSRLTRAGTDTGSPVDAPVAISASEPSDAQSILVTPLLLHNRLMGVLSLDSPAAGRFDVDDARLLEVLAGQLAVTIALHETGGFDPAVPPRRRPHVRRRSDETTVSFFEHDGTILVEGSYVIRGVPGRILFALLSEHLRSGRTDFTNRELRLDRSIGLPAGKDNLEARLLTLRRRLAERDDPFTVERVGRGQLRLTVRGPLSLQHHTNGDPYRR